MYVIVFIFNMYVHVCDWCILIVIMYMYVYHIHVRLCVLKVYWSMCIVYTLNCAILNDSK